MNARELARTLGLKPSGGEYRGDCPACGYAAAFSLGHGRDGRMLGWCASCGDGRAAGNMGRALALPPEVRRVLIAADPGAPGEAEAQRAAQRWIAEGRSVRIARTGHPARDFNDILRERAAWTA